MMQEAAVKKERSLRLPAIALAVLAAGAALTASAQTPSRTGWTDTFAADKKNFVSSGSNAFFRLEPGYTLVLAKGGERLVITVLEETRLVDGVETRVVEERESKGGREYKLYAPGVGLIKDGSLVLVEHGRVEEP